MFNFHKVPSFLKYWFKNYSWKISTTQKVIYLTFDDGPIPNISEFVLDTLKKYDAKATFFCVGDNIRKHPNVFNKIIADGHLVGNHTYHHLKGWKTTTDHYIFDIENCQVEIKKHIKAPAKLVFRPPYGRIKNQQAKILLPNYQIVMWDVLTCDYDATLNEIKCLKNAIKYTQKGSIVVFHDSLKAEKNLRYVLPKYLAHFSELGFKFEVL